MSLADVCGRPRDKNRAVLVSVQREVFSRYGIAKARPQDYEVDYLITPELAAPTIYGTFGPSPTPRRTGVHPLRTIWRTASTSWFAWEARPFHGTTRNRQRLDSRVQEVRSEWKAGDSAFQNGKVYELAKGSTTGGSRPTLR